jgi:putative DNA primase/helicase
METATENVIEMNVAKEKIRAQVERTPPRYKAPKGFIYKSTGVYRMEEDEDGGQREVKICSSLRIEALTRDETSQAWGRWLALEDADGVTHHFAMPMAMLAGDGVELRRELLSQGLLIEPGNKVRAALISYITNAEPTERLRCVSKTGWNQGYFILGNTVIDDSPVDEQIVFQSEYESARENLAFSVSGSLDDWRNRVSQLAIGNRLLIFAISAAFAGAVLHLIDESGGGIHFSGPSSIGKTNLLRTHTSVYGPFQHFARTWNSTINGIEAIAAARNDVTLVLDELGEANPKSVGETAYMLANGCGRTRANRQGGVRSQQTWRLLFISSGEIDLGAHMGTVNKSVKAGQEIRLLDIAADTGQHGIFEKLHGFPTGNALAVELERRTKQYYGTAGPAFIRELVNNPENVKQYIRRSITEWEQSVPRDADGQVCRAARRFALIGAAGELATSNGITGWPEGAATTAAQCLFETWVERRGGLHSQESATFQRQVRLFIEQHSSSHFTPLHDENPRPVINRAGYTRTDAEGNTEYVVLREVFRSEVLKGLAVDTAIKSLAAAGWLVTNNGKNTVPVRLPLETGSKQTRCYILTARIWE